MESAIDAFRVYQGSIPRSAPCSKRASIAAPSPATLPHAYSRSFSAPVADQPGLARPEHQRANARPAPMCESGTRFRRPNGMRGLGSSPWPRTAQGGCHGPTLFPPILLPGDQGSATCFSPLRRAESTVQGSPRRSQTQTQAAAGHHGRRRMSTPLTSGSGISARDAASW